MAVSVEDNDMSIPTPGSDRDTHTAAQPQKHDTEESTARALLRKYEDRSAAQGRGVPLMEGLRNLEKGYDRRFALSYCEDDVWAALEALERIAALVKSLPFADEPYEVAGEIEQEARRVLG